MDYCEICSQALKTAPSPRSVYRDTVEGRTHRLWRRPYPEFRLSATRCRLCSEFHRHCLNPPTKRRTKLGFFDLSEDERNQVHVEGSLYWGGECVSALVISLILPARNINPRLVIDNFSPTEESQGLDDAGDGPDADDDSDVGDDSDADDKVECIVYYTLAPAEKIPIGQGAPDLSCASQTHHMRWIRFWMQRCVSQHHHCRVANPGGWLPKRLLDVGSSSSVPTVRLVSSEQVLPGSAYVALSHRWSTTGMTKLTSDDTTEFEIPCLPESFQEAISLTQKLGWRYLWIDSLCINQNDAEDWKAQSAQMWMIYEHSICNFAATGAATSGRGLYSSVNWLAREENFATFAVDCAWTSRDASSGRLHLLMPDALDLFSGLEHSDINKRGWVLQERLLSPRTIHFAAKTLYWECRESHSMAFISKDNLYDLNITQNTKVWVERTREAMARFTEGRGSLAQVYESWESVRGRYASTAVTYQTDKLVALSSVAAVFERLLSDKYVAGIWKRTAIYDLLWRVSVPGKRSNHGAPSWSWASMEGRSISWPMDILPRYPQNSQKLARIINMEAAPHNPLNPTGRVNSGRMQLQCFALSFDARADTFCEDFLHSLRQEREPGTAPWQLPSLETSFDERRSKRKCQQLVCLPLVLENNMTAYRAFTLHGLIAADEGEGLYKRVGYFNCWWDYDNISYLHWYLDHIGAAYKHSPRNFYGLMTVV